MTTLQKEEPLGTPSPHHTAFGGCVYSSHSTQDALSLPLIFPPRKGWFIFQAARIYHFPSYTGHIPQVLPQTSFMTLTEALILPTIIISP